MIFFVAYYCFVKEPLRANERYEKNRNGRGQETKYTNTQTDIATNRPNWPSKPIWWKEKGISFDLTYCYEISETEFKTSVVNFLRPSAYSYAVLYLVHCGCRTGSTASLFNPAAQFLKPKLHNS